MTGPRRDFKWDVYNYILENPNCRSGEIRGFLHINNCKTSIVLRELIAEGKILMEQDGGPKYYRSPSAPPPTLKNPIRRPKKPPELIAECNRISDQNAVYLLKEIWGKEIMKVERKILNRAGFLCRGWAGKPKLTPKGEAALGSSI